MDFFLYWFLIWIFCILTVSVTHHRTLAAGFSDENWKVNRRWWAQLLKSIGSLAPITAILDAFISISIAAAAAIDKSLAAPSLRIEIVRSEFG